VNKTYLKSIDNSVGIVTRPLAGRSGVRIPEGTRNFSLLQDVQASSGAHIVLGYWGLFLLNDQATGA
jgi:hypothetical protein